MHRVKKTKSGFISIVTLIIVSILMTYVIYIMKIELSRKTYNNITKNVRCKEDIFSRKRECILTRLSKYIKNNIKDDIGEENLSKLLNKINEDNIKFEDVIVLYENKSKKLFIYFPYKLDTLRCEIYSCNIDIQSKKLKFQIHQIKYVRDVIKYDKYKSGD